MKSEFFYIKALTPIHAGSGETLGYVDMPIQREQHSDIPKIEASTLKGCIKNKVYKLEKIYEENTNEETKIKYELVFGSEKGEDRASFLGFTDAVLLFFPVKSDKDIFKLITCPYLLNRWVNDLDEIKEEIKEIKEGEYVSLFEDKDKNKKIYLEEYVFNKSEIFNGESEGKEISKLLKSKIKGIEENKIVILNDTDFIDLVNMYTEVITRNKIDSFTGVSAKTGLFTEEYLPSETILYFKVFENNIIHSSSDDNDSKKDDNYLKKDDNDLKKGVINSLKNFETILKYLKEEMGNVFQIGGNSTIGKGIVKRI
ncbi:CRISPR-associated protein Cmr4 [Oceanotoga teriensis]|uniref:CRISPR-associated protein Cmr4 n=1 Tax=Oceanotoga teriensis TaxID=515440 RepID=A0AA45C7J7_9BACT|nr:type III-B CRISPR module RAMP protein Cmr4 [Oceanotoga teriensis]PWJ95335.1 CRISPR-associated protein Cmr4 [Oceanotoga teriensis]